MTISGIELAEKIRKRQFKTVSWVVERQGYRKSGKLHPSEWAKVREFIEDEGPFEARKGWRLITPK